MFEEFKSRAMAELKEHFGAAASDAAVRIAGAATPAALRNALREAENLIESRSERVDVDAVRALFKRIGGNFV